MSGSRRSSTTTSKGSAVVDTMRSADAASDACSTSTPRIRERFCDRPTNQRLVVNDQHMARELFATTEIFRAIQCLNRTGAPGNPRLRRM